MDKFASEKRSQIMPVIHSRDTLPKIVVRKWLFANGYHFRVCDKRVVGHPDDILSRLKTLIEIRGCFWHHYSWECALKTVAEREKTFAKLARWLQDIGEANV